MKQFTLGTHHAAKEIIFLGNYERAYFFLLPSTLPKL